MLVRIDDSLRPHTQLAVFAFREVHVLPRHEALNVEIRNLVEDYRQRFAMRSQAGAMDVLKPARQMYASVGIDPTKTRPSSEALLRRILHGRELYRVNSVVDCFNLLALKFFVPVGLYDAATLRGDIVFRLGREGESYTGIGKEKIRLEDRYCLCDDSGPFGNPSSDSFRTRITADTRAVLAVFFVPSGWPHCNELLMTCPATLLRYHEARLVAAAVVLEQAYIDLADIH